MIFMEKEEKKEGKESCHGHGHGKFFVWSLLTLAVLGLIAVAIVSVARDGDRQDQYPNTLSVSGTHELDVAPDEAVLTIQVMTRGPKAADVSADNKQLVEKVTAQLQSLSSVKSEIETTGVTLQRWTEWNGKEQMSEDKGYEQITTMKITTSDIDRVGTLLDVAVSSGANSVVDVQFTLKPATQQLYKQQALTEATKVARAKAQLLADAAGTKLGEITSLNENSYVQPFYYNTKAEMAFDGAPSATPILPQKVTIQATVGISYELENDRCWK